jgi:hypothetical protein
MRRIGLGNLLLAVALLSLLGSIGEAQTESLEYFRNSLKGLNGVHVVIQLESPNKTNLQNITQDQLQNDTELRLRKAGIRVLSDQEWVQDFRSPALYVRVQVTPGSMYLPESRLCVCYQRAGPPSCLAQDASEY